MQIRELNQTWTGKSLLFRYKTCYHYRVSLTKTPGKIVIRLVREALPEPLVKSLENNLFTDWMIQPKAFGAFDGEALLGLIELLQEDWSNRLRIANI